MAWWEFAVPIVAERLFGGGGSEAEDIATGLSDEARALLRQAFEQRGRYGEPALEFLLSQLEDPYEDPYERALWQRTRGEIERAYRPGYVQGLEALSQRGLLSEPSSVLPAYTAAMDRARAGEVSQAALARLAMLSQRRRQAALDLSGALSGATGGAAQLAGAYQPLVQTYGGLAAEAAGQPYDWLSAITRLVELQRRGRGSAGPGAGAVSPSNIAARYEQRLQGPPAPTL